MALWVLVAILSAAVTYLALNDIKITNNKYIMLGEQKPDIKIRKPWHKYAIGLFCVVLIICGVFIYKDYKTKPIVPQNSIRVDINKATQKQLEELPNIGEVRATNLIKNRPYKNENQIIKVLGDKTYQSIKDKIKIGD